MINIVTALYHFLSLVVPIGKKLHSLGMVQRSHSSSVRDAVA
jgi:hypothetical protein